MMETKDYFQTKMLTDRITQIRMPGNVMTYLVKGDTSAVLIDTGCGLGPFRAFVEGLLDGLPYEVVLTHGHVDHAGGASEFGRVFLHEKDHVLAAKHTSKEIRSLYLRNQFPDFLPEDLVEPKEEGYLPLSYGQVFDLGGEELRIVNMGGHTQGSVGILFPHERILLSGDACCSFTLLFAHETSLSIPEYCENLCRLMEEHGDAFEQVIYSHPHNYGGPEVIWQMIELCGEILGGLDDHIGSRTLEGDVAYLAKAVDDHGRRKDGKIANLLYTEENLIFVDNRRK
ncbi:MAG: MBL fold metallo-hydrolase [Lachnospiraceae bacterium]|nr:MBL fold metallo-hydrolase [Lachnospiraceae bacterium]